ncbi:MAG: LamG domain-containing protein, partial [Candidatus Paceibacterota bacterium]
GSQQAITDGGILPGVLEIGSTIAQTPSLRDRGLVGYWTFDEGSGTTAYDRSGKGNNGTLTNSPTWQTGSNCKRGNCLSFVGGASNQYVNCGANLQITSSQYTVSGWVKIPSTAPDSTRHAFVRMGSSYPSFCPSFSNTQKPLMYLNGSNYRYGSSDVRNNQWSFFSFVVVGNQISDVLNAKIYLNGVIESAWATSIGATPIVPDGSCSIGSEYFDGFVDDIRIYNRALSEREILSIYNSTK